MNTVIQSVILCGGRGRRLWPVSTPQRPKQFLRLCQDGSLLEATAARVVSRAPSAIAFSRPIIVGSSQHQSRLVRMFPMAKIILEPVQRNTGPAIAAACLTCAPDTLVLVLPTDHIVADIDAFHQAIASGVAAARRGAIVTFGIDPTYPSTEFGYVQYDGEDGAQAAPVLTVKQFVEKPERPQAERYLAAGSFVWNAGIFLFQASAALESYEAFAPDLLDIVKKSAPDPASKPMTLAMPTMRSGSTARSLIRIGACGRSWKCSDPIGCIQSFHALLRQRNCCRRSTTRTSRPDRMAAGLMRQMRAVDRFLSRFQPASCII